MIQLVVTANGVVSAPDTVTITTENARPVANAGPDQTVNVDSVVNLDGNASTDANNDPLSFDWSLVARPNGSAAVLSLDMTPTPSFTADRPGEFVVQLVVNDGNSASDPDTAVITAVSQNRPPVAVVTADAVSVPIGTTVQLDGSASSDPDGDTLTYEWSIQVPAGSSAALSSTNTVDSSFVADQPGSYTITLIVRDEALESGSSSITVAAAAPNRAPTAAASANPSALTPPGVVTLDGSGSTDPDGDTLVYQWSLAVPAGSTAALSSATSVAPSFTADVVGNYVATLVVSDGELASASASVAVSATRDNRPPTLITVGDRVAFVGETLAFRLFATDPDAGDVLTFSLVSGPTGLGRQCRDRGPDVRTHCGPGRHHQRDGAGDRQRRPVRRRDVRARGAPGRGAATGECPARARPDRRSSARRGTDAQHPDRGDGPRRRRHAYLQPACGAIRHDDRVRRVSSAGHRWRISSGRST